jgi:hypothetical protein
MVNAGFATMARQSARSWKGPTAMDVVNPIVKRWQQHAAADPDAFWAEAA